jgi:hypothetical protein
MCPTLEDDGEHEGLEHEGLEHEGLEHVSPRVREVIEVRAALRESIRAALRTWTMHGYLRARAGRSVAGAALYAEVEALWRVLDEVLDNGYQVIAGGSVTTAMDAAAWARALLDLPPDRVLS